MCGRTVVSTSTGYVPVRLHMFTSLKSSFDVSSHSLICTRNVPYMAAEDRRLGIKTQVEGRPRPSDKRPPQHLPYYPECRGQPKRTNVRPLLHFPIGLRWREGTVPNRKPGTHLQHSHVLNTSHFPNGANMGGTRGHFPKGSNVTRPFSKRIKMVSLVLSSQLAYVTGHFPKGSNVTRPLFKCHGRHKLDEDA